jgi:hypothetical protein
MLRDHQGGREGMNVETKHGESADTKEKTRRNLQRVDAILAFLDRHLRELRQETRAAKERRRP